MKQVSFVAIYPPDLAHPIHQSLREVSGVSRVKQLMWGPTETVTTLLWFVTDQDTALDVLSWVESVTSAEFVPGDDGTYAFVHQTAYEFGDEVPDLVSEERVVFLPPIQFYDDNAVRFQAVGEASGLGDFYAQLTDILDAGIEQVQAYHGRPSPWSLTARQRAVLDAAVDLGYYDVPRRWTVTDVAAELDCARSTAGELLRKAEASVVRDTVRSQ